MAAELECVIERAVSLLSISTHSSILDAAIRSRFEFFPECFAGLHAALIESVQVKLLAIHFPDFPLRLQPKEPSFLFMAFPKGTCVHFCTDNSIRLIALVWPIWCSGTDRATLAPRGHRTRQRHHFQRRHF